MFSSGFKKTMREDPLAFLKTLPTDGYTVGGSGLLEAKGIRPANDYDVIMKPELFDALHAKTKSKIGISHLGSRTMQFGDRLEVFDSMPGSDLDRLIGDSEHINGVNYFSAKDLIKMKKKLGRPKDFADIAALKQLKKEK